MKKIISFVSILCAAALMLCMISNLPLSADSEATAQEIWTTEDLGVLQDYLLCRRDNGNGKDFDLNGDGVWNGFDLCLLRQEVLQSKDSCNILVVYFSCTGNTETVAEYITDYLDADSYEITPAVPYTAEDLNYNNSSCRANLEQNDASARPAISGNVENMEDYDIVFLGFPIWWGIEPRIIDTFMESYDFSDKTMIPFCTSGGSGIQASAANLKAMTTESTVWLDGRRFSGSATESSVTEWIDSLEIKGGSV